MKRFELIYNGVSSIFNASESGNGYTSKHNKAFSYWVVYTVRPSKTNTLDTPIEYCGEQVSQFQHGAPSGHLRNYRRI